MKKLFIALAGALLLAPACSNSNDLGEVENTVPPTLTTSDATAVFATGATLGGNVATAGSPAFVERGVCYGPDENPTVSNNRTPVEGVDLGAFEVSVANLTEQTSYHARAYANTPNGIVYGNDVRFLTGARAPDGPPVIGIYINVLTLQLDVKQTATVDYSIIPLNAGNKKVTWSSSAPSVATVDAETGLITGVDTGTATITVTTVDGGFTAKVTVTIAAENLLLNPGFEDPADNPAIDSEMALPANWESVPESWFESYYGIAASDITPAQVGTHDALCSFKIRASLANWYTKTYPGMQPVLTGNFTARIPSGTASAGTGGLYQVVTVTPGETYEFGCDIAFRDNNGGGAGAINSDMAVKILKANGDPLLDAGGQQIGIAYLRAITPVTTGTANLQYFFTQSYNTGVKATLTIPAGVTQIRFQVDQKNDHAVSGKWSPVMVWDACYIRQSQ